MASTSPRDPSPRSGHAHRADHRLSGQAQIDPDFPLLRKPYQFEELETVLSQALRR